MSLTKRHFFPEDYELFDTLIQEIKADKDKKK
jgi:hypothetical protein